MKVNHVILVTIKQSTVEKTKIFGLASHTPCVFITNNNNKNNYYYYWIYLYYYL